jgi:hypothetical protein
MSEGADSARPRGASDAREEPHAVERRVFRDTCAAVLIAVAACSLLAPWRVTTGILLGGALSLFNMYWLRSSVAAVFGAAHAGRPARMKAARYVLRYFVVVLIVVAANALGLVSLVATLAGMCAVVAALLAEGFRLLYFAIIRREET